MECLLELKAGRSYDVPIYDFATHSRRWAAAAAAAVPAARCRQRLAAAASGEQLACTEETSCSGGLCSDNLPSACPPA